MLHNITTNATSTNNIPPHFICPITREVMNDPVNAEDGNSYERAAILMCAQGGKIRSPITRELMSNQLFPNRRLKDAMEEYKKAQEAAASQDIAAQTTNTNSSSTTTAQLPIDYSFHDALIAQLLEALECDMPQIGAATAQAMVALAGIVTSQSDAGMDIDATTGGTKVTFKFNNPQDHHRLVQYYRTTYEGSILNQGVYDPAGKKAVIILDANIFYNKIAKDLREYHRNWFAKLPGNLAAKLQVALPETVSGDAVERRLVAKAGIYKRQPRAMYRSNPDYSVRFHLQLANQQEYNQFITYYTTNYPRFILRHEGYKPDLSIIHVNTKVLLDGIAPALQAAVETQIPPLTHEQLIAQFSQDLRCTSAQFPATAGQVLGALAGVYTSQDSASCTRPANTAHTAFILCFSSISEHQRLLQYYNSKYQGLIIGQSAYEQNAKRATVTMDSSQLFNGPLKNAIVEHKQGWFGKLMQNLATGLNVPYAAIDAGGDALEKGLVRHAEINTSQTQAQYRGNTDYSARLHLAFASGAEYQQFVVHYKQHYPGFILRDEGYKAPLSVIHVSTRVLVEVVVPAIARDEGRAQ